MRSVAESCLFVGLILVNPLSAQNGACEYFSEDFSETSSNTWHAGSGTWAVTNGQLSAGQFDDFFLGNAYNTSFSPPSYFVIDVDIEIVSWGTGSSLGLMVIEQESGDYFAVDGKTVEVIGPTMSDDRRVMLFAFGPQAGYQYSAESIDGTGIWSLGLALSESAATLRINGENTNVQMSGTFELAPSFFLGLMANGTQTEARFDNGCADSNKDQVILRPGPGANDGSDNGGAMGGKDTFTDGSQPDLNRGADPWAFGYARSTCNQSYGEAYLQFDIDTLPINPEKVFLGVSHVPHTAYCYSNCDLNFYFYPILEPWDEMTLIFAAPPALGAPLFGPVHMTFPNDPGDVEYDITAIYNLWKGGQPNYGLAFYSPDQGCNNASITFSFYSSDYEDEQKRPYLRVVGGQSATQRLNVSRLGSGQGTVTSLPAGIHCGVDCSEDFPLGTQVSLSASPGAGSVFAGWLGDCSGAGDCSLSMDQERTVAATFEVVDNPPKISMTAPASGATVSGNITIQATASDDRGVSRVEFFINGIKVVERSAAPYSYQWNTRTVSNGQHTLKVVAYDTADQTAEDQTTVTVDNRYALTVTKTGTGQGTVTSSPAGIDCGDDCTESYPKDTPVTLTANPALGSTFDGWSGACSGSQNCSVAMNAEREVSARFGLAPVNQPPRVSITSPADGSEVRGVIRFEASVDDDQGISHVAFSIDGILTGQVSSPPYQLSWDSTTVTNGRHALQVLAHDLGGLTASAQATVEVVNGLPETSLQARKYFFPFCQANGASFTGLAVSNFSDQVAQLDFTAYSTTGQQVDRTRHFLLDPGSQFAKLTTEVFDESSSVQSLWVEMSSDNPQVGSFFQFGAGGDQLDGSVPATRTSDVLYFTRVFQGQQAYRGQAAETWISIANPNSGPVTIELRLVLTGEGSKRSRTVTIEGKGFLYSNIADLFGDESFSSGFVEARVVNGGGIAGFQLVLVPRKKTVIGLNPQTTARHQCLYSAQLASLPGFFTNVKLVNAGNENLSVTLRATADDGQPLGQIMQTTLAPGAFLERDAGDLFSLPADSTAVGSLIVQADQPGLIGDIVFGFDDARAAAALPFQTETLTRGIFSQVVNVADLFTGLALLNPGEELADLDLRVYSVDGEETGRRSLTLGPGQRISRLLTEWMNSTQGQVRGYVDVRSTQPLIAQQLFGNTNLLSAVPPALIGQPARVEGLAWQDLEQAQIRMVNPPAGEEADGKELVSGEFEISLSGTGPTGGEIRVSIPVDTSLFSDSGQQHLFQAEVFDSATGVWTQAGSNFIFDQGTNSVSFTLYIPGDSADSSASNRFRDADPAGPTTWWKNITTRLWRWSTLRYQHVIQLKDSNFIIHYYDPGNGKNNCPKDWNGVKDWARGDPRVNSYVWHLDQALNEVYALLSQLTDSEGEKILKALPLPQHVYIMDLGGEAGDSPPGGPLSIGTGHITSFTDMKATAAHELMHVFQGYLRSPYDQPRWFMEATANYFSALVNNLDDQERTQLLYADTGSQGYLTRPLNAENQDSFYALAYFLDWISLRYGNTAIVGDIMKLITTPSLGLTGRDPLTALGLVLLRNGETEGLKGSFENYVVDFVTHPEGVSGFQGQHRSQMAGNMVGLNSFSAPSLISTLGGLQFSKARTFLRVERQDVPMLSTSYFNVTYHAALNPNDILFVIDTQHSQVLGSKSYLFPAGDSDNHYQSNPPFHAGTEFSRTKPLQVTVENPPIIEHLMVHLHKEPKDLSVDYYILNKPRILQVEKGSVTWSTEELGNIPIEMLKGYRVFQRLPDGTYQEIGDGSPVLPSNPQTTQLELSSPVIKQGDDIVVVIEDRLGNSWPKIAEPVDLPPDGGQVTLDFEVTASAAECFEWRNGPYLNPIFGMTWKGSSFEGELIVHQDGKLTLSGTASGQFTLGQTPVLSGFQWRHQAYSEDFGYDSEWKYWECNDTATGQISIIPDLLLQKGGAGSYQGTLEGEDLVANGFVQFSHRIERTCTGAYSGLLRCDFSLVDKPGGRIKAVFLSSHSTD